MGERPTLDWLAGGGVIGPTCGSGSGLAGFAIEAGAGVVARDRGAGVKLESTLAVSKDNDDADGDAGVMGGSSSKGGRSLLTCRSDGALGNTGSGFEMGCRGLAIAGLCERSSSSISTRDGGGGSGSNASSVRSPDGCGVGGRLLLGCGVNIAVAEGLARSGIIRTST